MIRGFYLRKGAATRPYIKGNIVFPGIGEKDISFLVDTGADLTIIGEKDAIRFGPDYGKLERAKRDMGGIGGKVETYRAEVVLKIEPDFTDRRKVLVVKNKIPDNITNKEKEQLKNLPGRIPSILGRDIIVSSDYSYMKK